jgi:O-antigen/teichoic acid export membrane protein
MRAPGAFQRLRNSPMVVVGGSGMYRLLGLIARFALTLYIARFLGFRAMSSYGFVTAGSAGMIALSGLGLDYRVSRHIVSMPGLPAIAQIRDRILLRSIALAVILAVGLLILALVHPDGITVPVPAALILFLEPIVYDLQQALNARHRPLAGNMILFVRAAIWIPFVAALGLAAPEARTIEVIFWGWVAGLVLAIAVAILFCVRWGLVVAVMRRPINWRWIRTSARSAPVVYLSEIGAFGQIYSDRFIIAYALSKEAAGLYIFLWSMTNSIVPLVQAAIFNRTTPLLVRQWRDRSLVLWEETMASAKRSILLWGGGWSALLVAANALIPVTGHPLGLSGTLLIATMALATVVRLRADLMHQALYSGHRDSDWIAVNLLGLLLSPILAFAGVTAFGLVGGGLQMLALALVLLVMRGKLVRLMIRDRDKINGRLLPTMMSTG